MIKKPFPYKLRSWAQRRSKVLLAETTVSSRYEAARSVTLRNEKPSTTKKTFLTPQPQKKFSSVDCNLHPNGCNFLKPVFFYFDNLRLDINFELVSEIISHSFEQLLKINHSKIFCLRNLKNHRNNSNF